MALTYKDVADIIKIIDASNCDEVIIELGETKIVVRRGAGATTDATVAPPPHRPAQAIPPDRPKLAAAANAPVPPAEADAAIVRAPMTGTFYRAPSPKDPPFVEAGSNVKKGDTLCTIEVMKLFTTILAETDGIVTQIYVDDATLVQIDQPIFRIEAR